MADPRFFRRSEPLTLSQLADIADAEIINNARPDHLYSNVKALDVAGGDDVSFLDNKQYVAAFTESAAGACVVKADYVDRAPAGMALLVTAEPYLAYAKIATYFYPVPAPQAGVSPNASVDATAHVDATAQLAPGCVVLANATVGPGCRIGPGAVVGEGVEIGEHVQIGSNASLSHCLIGDRTIIHPGVSIGQDGFGFALSSVGHFKVPQLGRVVVEGDVEIGANTTIDRGAGPDTVIGAGTKIDNLVQIAHNVQIGRGCIIVSQVGISGSTKIGDFVVIGGQAGLTGHLEIGSGVKVAARSGVMRNIEPGMTVGGAPAKPMRDWLKEVAYIERLVKGKSKGK